jgi:phospholipid/cholesterol/gamma-HCH transport system permease protein
MVHENYIFHLGRYINMLRTALSKPEKFAMYWKEGMRQMNDIGVGSVIIVCLISIFIGGVAALQFAYQLDGQLIPSYYIGYNIYVLSFGRQSWGKHGL